LPRRIQVCFPPAQLARGLGQAATQGGTCAVKTKYFGVSFIRVDAKDQDLHKFPYLLEVLDPGSNVKVALQISNIFANALFQMF
jgi:hypothetical protein